MSDTPIPLEDWQNEVAERGKLDCKFVCPICANRASPNDWRRLDAKHSPDRAARECIGRALPRAERHPAFSGDDPEQGKAPCDYAAFGLLDLCTRHVLLPDGTTVGVFEFA